MDCEMIYINGDILIGGFVVVCLIAYHVWKWVWRDDNNLFGDKW